MTIISRALAVSLLSGAFLLPADGAFAQGTGSGNASPPTTATRPTTPDQNTWATPGSKAPNICNQWGRNTLSISS
jgi:hypothetical protein